ncbi:hypothetical protein [Collimonas sp.]|uniref:hypothetical protein n=1 Tax=Collimonas sp. TaxID=1963772 RepID=UPI002B9F9F87|nr:hypothetical protein [Collimonas sp.]HWW04205.1 hypothetical protein [Collimonas sp.]
MRMEKWENFFRMHLPFVSATGPVKTAVEARLPYRVVTLCSIGDAALVEQLIRQQLRNAHVIQYHRSKPIGKGNLTNITIEILCSISERADLVQLVSRLGLEKNVRSVRWESIPNKLLA